MKTKPIVEKMKRGFIGVLLVLFSFSLQSCSVDDIIDYLLQIVSETGWLADKENMNNIPEDITPFPDPDPLPNPDPDDPQPEPARTKFSLEDKFPPIGDQGQYGTCVAWSVGYNLKTALNAIEKGWSAGELASKSNQTSPKDLWFSISSNDKGTQCNGTNFEPAMDALIAKGASNLNASPYSNLGNCTGSGTGDSQNKLANYRKIASETQGLTVDNFKGYLNSGRPIAIGAKLGDRFMDWSSNEVINTDTYNNPGMQHAYHAMVLVGYDDSKGNGRGAFRVRNSWGTSWGDDGSIWIDYDFFCSSFCFAAFVAQNVNSVSAGADGTISSSDLSKGYDLLAYYAEDYEYEGEAQLPPNARSFTYEVYNSGNKKIEPKQDWSVVYMIYDATDAKTYEIIYVDYYTDDFYPNEDEVSDGPYEAADKYSLAGGWWNMAFVEPGKMAGEAEYGEYGFEITYLMPNFTGKYYLVVMADAYNVIDEVNEDNNFYFITAANGKPLVFEEGRILNMPSAKARSLKQARPEAYSNTENQTAVKPGNLNAYTPQELKAMLLHDKKTGRLQSKISGYKARSLGNMPTKRARK